MHNKKTYLLITVFSIILLFCTAAVCNNPFAAASATAASSSTGDNENGPGDNIEENKDDQKSSFESDAAGGDEDSKKEGQSSESTDNKNESGSKDSNTSKPTIKLVIYDGPDYSAADDVCYYRVEAQVTGNPKPKISFSKDDSKGAFGSNKAQVNIKRNEVYTLTATATNSQGSATGAIDLKWGCDGNQNNNQQQGNAAADFEIIEIALPDGDLLTNSAYGIYAVVIDKIGRTYKYKWSATGGTIEDSQANPIKWTAPGFPETYTLKVTVTAPDTGVSLTKERAIRVYDSQQGQSGNSPPVLGKFEIAGGQIRADGTLFFDTVYYIFVSCTDPDGDSVTFDWEATSGTIINEDANTLQWRTGSVEGNYAILLWADDGNGGMAYKEFSVYVK